MLSLTFSLSNRSRLDLTALPEGRLQTQAPCACLLSNPYCHSPFPVAASGIVITVYLAGRIRLAPRHRASSSDIPYLVYVFGYELCESGVPRAHCTVSVTRLFRAADLCSRILQESCGMLLLLIQPCLDAKPHVDPHRLWSNLACVFTHQISLLDFHRPVLRRSSVYACNFSWFSVSGRVSFPDIPSTYCELKYSTIDS